MLKEKVEVSLFFYILLDIIVVIVSFFGAFYFRAMLFSSIDLREAWILSSYVWFLWIVIPLWILLLVYERAYFSLERKTLKELIIPVTKAVIEGFLVILAVLFFAKIFAKSRLFFVIFAVSNVLLLTFIRWITYIMQAKIFRNPPFYHNILIVGTGKKAKDVERFFKEHSRWGIKIEGFLGIQNQKSKTRKQRILGTIEDLSSLLRSSPIDWVVFALPFKENRFAMEGIKVCKELGIFASCLISDFFPSQDVSLSLEVYNDLPLINFRTTSVKKWDLLLKGIFDRLIAAVMLIALLPLYVGVTLAIKVSSKGPVLFKQERCGVNGRKFDFYKFRTMVSDAENRKNELLHLNPKKVVFKITNDPRITNVGKFLRRSSIDELPQLFNVLKGDMSFVGPRPPVPEEVNMYEDWQRRRLSMKPGLTCLWQVNGRAEIDFDEWLKLDLEYIDKWSLSLDMKILLKTIPAVLSTKGAY